MHGKIDTKQRGRTGLSFRRRLLWQKEHLHPTNRILRLVSSRIEEFLNLRVIEVVSDACMFRSELYHEVLAFYVSRISLSLVEGILVI